MEILCTRANNGLNNIIKISFLLLSFYVSPSESITCESNGNTDYPYNLPIRNIVNCPGFETFTFSCHNYHVIDIDSLKFSPYSADPSGECSANWSSECQDKGHALAFLKKLCSGHNSCMVNSNKLRSMSKCILNEVISVSYKCVPTWEVMDVPIKCDLCKNVTFTTGIYPNFGFLHSSWYGTLDPYVTCVSQIQNKPNHIIVIYTVNGFIGLDQILIETYNEFGVHISKVVSGNLTTNLILTSNYNVNITILPQSYQIFNQPNFLLYYYVVPKCEYMLCPNKTVVYPPVTYPPVTYIPTTLEITTEIPNTFAPPLIADKSKKHRNGHAATISDAWLAAILALVYAVLMIFAVLVAIYFRRRRKGRIFNQNQVMLSPSMMSVSRVITPATQSQISLSEASIRKSNMNQFNNFYLNDQTKTSEYNHIYSREQTYEEYDSQNQRMQQDFADQRTIQNANNQFDNFSQVINNEDNFFSGGRSMLVNSEVHHQTVQYNAEYSQQTTMHQERSVEMNSTIYPSSLRGNTIDLNTIRSSETNQITMSQNSDLSQKSGYRADAETLRTTNSDDFGEISSQALKIDRINTSELIKQTNSHISTFNTQETKKTITLNEENNITVNLFQPAINEKETQEMTMFVENSHDDFNTGRQFKIDLNN